MRIFLMACSIMLSASGAFAQALAPMEKSVTTYTDRFAVQLKAYNPYPSAQRFQVRILNEDGGPARGVAATAHTLIVPPNDIAGFYVWGESPVSRHIEVCLTSQFFATGEGAMMRGEVCGKYIITRR
ncbi:hypothetical protein PUV54_07220 [Hyphococcus flavus]|uniref:Uncharacterized protein n=1 Tax=Hyphococcus flavus TaxID=1866326 RepID=A0AAE9ZE79_9PROT|nr:hypothetical protein [Hyphococcus flavus]WDI32986.1 hypothetical protein PUV54_07220 [Hyphococcus flavus]